MTRHPAKVKKCTPHQIAIFEQIGAGIACPPSAMSRTFKALERKGLIQRTPDKVLGADGFGAISIPQYQQPILVHMQWCAWCSENISDEELEASTPPPVRGVRGMSKHQTPSSKIRRLK